jgi:putative ABC transport system permease protein
VRIEHWRYAVPLWLRGLLHRRGVERDLDEEIRNHIDQQTAANIASGMRADDARRAALVAFGGVERIKDESRDARRLSIIDSIGQLRYTVRSLWRARTFTIATVTTIALGIGAGSAGFTLIDAVLLRPLPYADSDRLVGLWHSFPGIGIAIGAQSPGSYATYRASAKSFESIGAYSDGELTVTYDDPSLDPERLPASGVAGSLFPMLRIRPLLGRVILDADEAVGAPPVVVISEQFWRTRLGARPDVIGRRLHIDGVDREVVGVLPASFAFPGSDVRLWVPINVAPNAYLGNFTFRAIGRLRLGISVDAARRELQSILLRIPETFPEQMPGVSTAKLLVQTKAAAIVHTMQHDAIGGFGRILWLVGATIVVLLIVAFSNVASLTLARIEARQRELAVRTTLGASRARIWWSIIAETGMLSVVGGLIGFGMAAAALTVLVNAGPSGTPDPRIANEGIAILPRLNELHVGWTLLLTVFTLTTLFCIMSGLISSWRLWSTDAIRLLRDGGRSGTIGRRSQRVRAAVVLVEVALSLVLLSGSAVLGRSVARLAAVQPGFNSTNVLTFWMQPPRQSYRTPGDVARFYREAVDRIERTTGVSAAAVVSKIPLQGGATSKLVWVEDAMLGGRPPSQPYELTMASSGYFDAMQIPVVAGRSFDVANVVRGTHEAVVSRSFAMQHWSDSSGGRALGRRVRPFAVGPWFTIVGVVADVRDTALTAPAGAMLYLPNEASPDSIASALVSRYMGFVIRTLGPASAIAPAVERQIHAIDPKLAVFGRETMEQTLAKAGRRMTFALWLLIAGALATLTLGVIGLYGVIAYVVGMRSREIGIRIALGLAPAHAARWMLRQGDIIVVGGAVIGLLVFFAFARLLRSLAFEVSVLDGPALATAVAIVFAVASIATWIPARRAARINPADALKNE